MAEKELSKNQLLLQLRNADKDEGRKIRAKLRKLGHFGGLGEGRGRPRDKKAKGKAVAKKKPSRAVPRRAVAPANGGGGGDEEGADD
jgi:hypothetical protein